MFNEVQLFLVKGDFSANPLAFNPPWCKRFSTLTLLQSSSTSLSREYYTYRTDKEARYIKAYGFIFKSARNREMRKYFLLTVCAILEQESCGIVQKKYAINE